MSYHDKKIINTWKRFREENKDLDFIKTVKILYYDVKEIGKRFPNWIPINERSLVIYLSENPKTLSKNARLIGYEVYKIDILFEDKDNLYVVETKHINSDSISPLVMNNIINQLKRYCNVLKKKNIEKKINPVIAIMMNNVKIDESIIKTDKCKVCGEEIVYPKQYCSLKCLENYLSNKKLLINNKNNEKINKNKQKMALIDLFLTLNSLK